MRTLGALREGEVCYYNPNHKVRLIGTHNEVRTEINVGLKMTLVDSGAQISTIYDALRTKLDLPMWQLPDEVNFVGFGGITFKNKGYTRIRLLIPGIEGFDKNVLLFIQPDSDYTKNVPVLLGNNIIDFILEHATVEELNNLEPEWGWGSIRTLVETKQLELEKLAELQKDSMTGKIDHYV